MLLSYSGKLHVVNLSIRRGCEFADNAFVLLYVWRAFLNLVPLDNLEPS